ncbi:uncharacterized protein BYT42DRAFT_615489 [Radiomyces spectabilis]|uniref:uncharacterized protein n=1 Tax=Radiomyces spectabilis TaxID=64574 RepID=UPI00221E7738|nr:uncharacterized protein BYT42DRAFT_615489 [Radiomyces spectabilis]KAI8374315.1 hypothetical protein BYT42DRAFT_615489 [Radiomyces spectabilis]
MDTLQHTQIVHPQDSFALGGCMDPHSPHAGNDMNDSSGMTTAPPLDRDLHGSASEPTSDLQPPSSPPALSAATKENPVTETKIIDRESFTEDERRHNREWFGDRPSRTPERYMRIRNHILDSWQTSCPNYITKSAARKNLQENVDVNAVGRIHAYLEKIGAINVGCAPTTRVRRPVQRTPRKVYVYSDEEEIERATNKGSRKRRLGAQLGYWGNSEEFQSRRVVRRPQPIYQGGQVFADGYDPFQLVPVEYYDDHYPAPFTVEVATDALLVMDFHSHLAYTEIIGLMGGTFHTRDNGTKVISIKCVFPCRSTSTGIQCEMDPVSEMQAREVFEQKGLTVVGWYHSHPTFEPHPSVRDIENQASYQTLFRDKSTGDEPFIGVIVTPYDPEVASNCSKIQYLHISRRWDTSNSYRIPYACQKQVMETLYSKEEVLRQLHDLVEEYKDYEHKIDMNLLYGAQRRLGKLLEALNAHIVMPASEKMAFLKQVETMMIHRFMMENPSCENQMPTIDPTAMPDMQRKELRLDSLAV